MSSAHLFLSGIRASGRHGARPGEKDEPQDFVVDLDVEVDAAADSIETTSDYRRIVETVRALVRGGSFDLIEAMAEAIAREVLALERVTRVTAVVHKPGAAARLEVEGVAAAVTLDGETR
jgi:dihydroneopterin aldolase